MEKGLYAEKKKSLRKEVSTGGVGQVIIQNRWVGTELSKTTFEQGHGDLVSADCICTGGTVMSSCPGPLF